MSNNDTGYGFKALDPTGATYPSTRRDGTKEMLYPLPRPGEKWGPWFDHPYPVEPDGEACGPGRFHVWNSLSLQYGPPGAYPWFLQWQGWIGGDDRKTGVRRLRLRRIKPQVLRRALRPPFNWGKSADLHELNLDGANLSRADLSGANLSRANLYGADLSRADLSGANLYGANLSGANLYGADLSRADLYGANLYGANLYGANLYGANLYGANLDGARWDKHTIWPAEFTPSEAAR